MTEVQLALARELESFQQRAAVMWRGYEKEAVIALVRVLDSIAVGSMWNSSGRINRQGEHEDGKFFALMGAAAALRPFLSVIKGQPGGVPWGPLSDNVRLFACTYLDCCGKLTHLRRMAELERYGLASTSSASPSDVTIKAQHGAPELALLFAMRSSRKRGSPSRDARPDGHQQRLSRRMHSYVDAADGWFIRYDNDADIVRAYRHQATLYGKGYFEAEAFPDDVVLGDRSFGAWREACDQALGRILCHIDFADLLQRKRPGIVLNNVLTIFARREDVGAVWQEAGLDAILLNSTMSALTLEIDGLDDWENAYETPCPFYVDLGKDFVLLPSFGALTNPYFALFRHLRGTQKLDWDRGVDRREAVFRADLARLFPAPRFVVPPNGVQLFRPNGSKLTDLDAIVVDRESGTLALVQLKWHDVFGRSLAERESRRRNISMANQWISRVAAWIAGRSSHEVALGLGLQVECSERPPILYVIARYAARFSGEQTQDPRAFWLGWPEIVQAAESGLGTDPLSRIPLLVAEHQARFASLGHIHEEFRFPGLTVDFHVSSGD